MASDSRVATLRATVPALLGVAVAIVVPVVLALVGMILVGSAEWIDAEVTEYKSIDTLRCPRTLDRRPAV